MTSDRFDRLETRMMELKESLEEMREGFQAMLFASTTRRPASTGTPPHGRQATAGAVAWMPGPSELTLPWISKIVRSPNSASGSSDSKRMERNSPVRSRADRELTGFRSGILYRISRS